MHSTAPGVLIGCDAPRNWLAQGEEREGKREEGRLNADDVEGPQQIEKGGGLGGLGGIGIRGRVFGGMVGWLGRGRGILGEALAAADYVLYVLYVPYRRRGSNGTGVDYCVGRRTSGSVWTRVDRSRVLVMGRAGKRSGRRSRRSSRQG